jgi:hypothetical protein
MKALVGVMRVLDYSIMVRLNKESGGPAGAQDVDQSIR